MNGIIALYANDPSNCYQVWKEIGKVKEAYHFLIKKKKGAAIPRFRRQIRAGYQRFWPGEKDSQRCLACFQNNSTSTRHKVSTRPATISSSYINHQRRRVLVL